MRAISIYDFWPPYEPAIEDFYPGGVSLKVRLSLPEDLSVPLMERVDRIIHGEEAKREILILMLACESVMEIGASNKSMDIYRAHYAGGAKAE